MLNIIGTRRVSTASKLWAACVQRVGGSWDNSQFLPHINHTAFLAQTRMSTIHRRVRRLYYLCTQTFPMLKQLVLSLLAMSFSTMSTGLITITTNSYK
jgi:hypothetical protein